MSVTLVGILVLSAAGAGWYLLRNRVRNGQTQQASQYPGVAIEAATEATTCAAIRLLDGKRFLPHEAPILPLADCDVEHCNCCYVRYRDRRSEEDRRSIYGANRGTPVVPDQRKGNGRRATDREDVASIQ